MPKSRGNDLTFGFLGSTLALALCVGAFGCRNQPDSQSRASGKDHVPRQLSPLEQKVGRLLNYPAEALRNRSEGTVVVRVVVEGGRATSTEVIESSSHAVLDHAVLEALGKVTLSPADEGTNIIRMEFRLWH